jgi:hypothetical protein
LVSEKYTAPPSLDKYVLSKRVIQNIWVVRLLDSYAFEINVEKRRSMGHQWYADNFEGFKTVGLYK